MPVLYSNIPNIFSSFTELYKFCFCLIYCIFQYSMYFHVCTFNKLLLIFPVFLEKYKEIRGGSRHLPSTVCDSMHSMLPFLNTAFPTCNHVTCITQCTKTYIHQSLTPRSFQSGMSSVRALGSRQAPDRVCAPI